MPENLPPAEKEEKWLEIWKFLDGIFWQFWLTDFGKTGFTDLLNFGMVLLPILDNKFWLSIIGSFGVFLSEIAICKLLVDMDKIVCYKYRKTGDGFSPLPVLFGVDLWVSFRRPLLPFSGQPLQRT